MFIDEARIFLKAGNGGNGAVSFRKELYVPAGGPEGGDGGKGASIVIQADENLRTLMDFRYQKKYTASNGQDGGKKNMKGSDGEDLILKVPPGTIVIDQETNLVIADLKNDKDKSVIVKGGNGGRGNAHFKTPTRQAPRFAKAGGKGEEREVRLELKLIADVGLLGFPNVGKSTFLSVVSKAKPKIANYHFTTLVPNLGVVKTRYNDSFVIADIPGLIEGAHEGIGLGHEFLKHVERTKLLIHIVDVSGIEGRDPIEDFDKINQELQKYSPKLSKRMQVVVANKMDIPQAQENFSEFEKELTNRGYKVFAISGATRQGIEEVIDYVSLKLREIEETIVVEEEELYKNYISNLIEEENANIEITIEDGEFIVESQELSRILYSVNFEDMESLRYFQSILEKKGVFEKLKEKGIKDGDSVRIYDLEFEYYE